MYWQTLTMSLCAPPFVLVFFFLLKINESLHPKNFTFSQVCGLIRLEKLKMRSLRSNAKIIGTVMCVGGAVSMALFRGPKLLNSQLLPPKSLLVSGDDEDWLLGCFLLFGSSFCWSLWLILQVLYSWSLWILIYTYLLLVTLAPSTVTQIPLWPIHSWLRECLL